MASGALTASPTQCAVGQEITLAVSISDYSNNAITIAADGDPGGGTDWQNVTVDGSGAGKAKLTPANAGTFKFTVSIDGNESGDTTVTVSGPATTTAAPASTPASTTTAHAATTAAPSPTTTAAPAASTTAAPAPTTTVAPGTTTAAPAPTTTVAPAGTTTAAPNATTTAPGAGSGAGSGDVPTVEASFTIDPDDGTQQNPKSLQVAKSVKLTLNWQATNADSVNIASVGQGLPASGNKEVPTEDASYSIIAVGKGGQSQPVNIEVHTHDDGQVVSGHVALSSGVASVVSFSVNKNGQPVTSASIGDKLTLVAVVSDATQSVQINGKDADLTELGSGHKQASVDFTVDASCDGDFHCVAMGSGGGSGADSPQHIDINGAGSGAGSGAGAGTHDHTGAGTHDHTGAGTHDHTGAGTHDHTGAGTHDHTGAGTHDHTGAGTHDHTGAGSADHTGAGTGDHLVHFQLLDEQSGSPLCNVRCLLRGPDGTQLAELTTDDTGHIQHNVSSPGPYDLAVLSRDDSPNPGNTGGNPNAGNLMGAPPPGGQTTQAPPVAAPVASTTTAAPIPTAPPAVFSFTGAPPDRRTGDQFVEYLITTLKEPRSGNKETMLFPPASPNREELSFNEIATLQNVPEWMNQWQALDFSGGGHTIRAFVTPDYLCVGTRDNYFRVSMGAYVAQRIADARGCSLITSKIADKIYAQASVKLVAHDIPQNSINTYWYKTHEDVLQGRTACSRHGGKCSLPSGFSPGTLVAGHKKDAALGVRIKEMHGDGQRGKSILTFFGFYNASGQPIQKYKDSGRHQAGFNDYSQGVRLMYGKVLVDGKDWKTMADVLADSTLAPLVSDDGPIPSRYPAPQSGTYSHGDNV